MPGRAISKQESLSTLTETVPALFQQSQTSVNNHRKNVTLLHRVFDEAASVADDDSGTLLGEKTFAGIFKDMVDRILDVKRGITQADYALRFVASFIDSINEKDSARANDEGSSAARLTSNLFKHLLKAFPAKNKNVRLRSCQLVALLINVIPDVDENMYAMLLEKLCERARDREASVRVHAVVALSKLQDPDEDLSDADSDSPIALLCKIMQQDTSAEVRRAALFQVAVLPQTLPVILSRAKDVDSMTRRMVFHSVLSELPPFKHLTFEQREQVIGCGLKDRDASVKRSASRLISKWASDAEGGILAFLEDWDVLRSSNSAQILTAIFETEPSIVEAMDFGDGFFANLTPASACILRNYVAYCTSIQDDRRLEEVLPVVTELAFKIEAEHNELIILVDRVRDSESKTEDQKQKDLHALESKTFVMNELLVLALKSDYSDESGRRKMFALIRDIISQAELPTNLIQPCLDILVNLSAGEGDFMRIVVEVVQWIREDANVLTGGVVAESEDNEEDGHEDEDDPNAFDPDIPAEAPVKFTEASLDLSKADVHVRCLTIVRGLLERVTGALQDNAALTGLVTELIVPSVKCKHEEIRTQGLVCLGLCSLIDQNMALDSFGLFVQQSHVCEKPLQESLIKAIFDIVTLYGTHFLSERGHGAEPILDFMLHSLEQGPEVQAIACIGISKLMLSGMLSDDNVLQNLLLVYFAPETINNQVLRQCLSYFFTVYCFSNPANQLRMKEIFLSSIEVLSGVYDDTHDKENMVTPLQVAAHIIDWTDPRRLVTSINPQPYDEIHLDLGINVARELYNKERTKDERKVLCQSLNKLYISPQNKWKIANLIILLQNVSKIRPLTDAVSRNALSRFEKSLLSSTVTKQEEAGEEDQEEKAMTDEIDYDNQERLREMEKFTETFEFLDAMAIEEEVIKKPTKSTSKARRSSKGTKSVKPRKSRAKMGSDEDDSDEHDDLSIGLKPSESPAPVRRSARSSEPQRRKTAATDAELREILEDETSGEEEDDDDGEQVDNEEQGDNEEQEDEEEQEDNEE